MESETLEVSSDEAGIVFPSSPEPEAESEPEVEPGNLTISLPVLSSQILCRS